jgi:hypothetical protein
MTTLPERDPRGFKLQIWIPWELYDALMSITGHEGSSFHGRIKGGFTRIVILALRNFLEQPEVEIEPMKLEDI